MPSRCWSVLMGGASRSVVTFLATTIGAAMIVYSLLDLHRLPWIVPGVVLLVVGGIYFMIARLGAGNSNAAFGRLTGRLITLDRQAISFEPLQRLPWSEIVAIGVLDRRHSIGFTSSNPRRTWGESFAQGFSRSSGVGAISVSIIVAGGDRVRAMTDARNASFVALAKRKAGQVRRGQILLTPDTVISIEAVHQLVAALSIVADDNGIPITVTSDLDVYWNALSATTET